LRNIQAYHLLSVPRKKDENQGEIKRQKKIRQIFLNEQTFLNEDAVYVPPNSHVSKQAMLKTGVGNLV